jgi:hypothetical protein
LLGFSLDLDSFWILFAVGLLGLGPFVGAS